MIPSLAAAVLAFSVPSRFMAGRISWMVGMHAHVKKDSYTHIIQCAAAALHLNQQKGTISGVRCCTHERKVPFLRVKVHETAAIWLRNQNDIGI
jgi:hypothetical protein